MAAPPRSFSNRYEVVRALARGGMADVYLARDQLLDRPVAVKVLFPEYARDPSFVERFRREAQAAANLSHPNIVAIYDWGQEDETYFIVMEYVDGESLRDALRARGHERGAHPDRFRDGHRDVLLAGAGAGPSRRRPFRRVLARRRALRDADGRAAVLGRHADRGRVQARPRGAGRAVASRPRPVA